MPLTDEMLTVPAGMVPRGANYVLRVTGDGMHAEQIRDGDFLIVNPCEDAEQGALVIVEVAGVEGKTLCRLRRDGEDAFIDKGVLRQVFRSEDVRVCGVVVGVIRKY